MLYMYAVISCYRVSVDFLDLGLDAIAHCNIFCGNCCQHRRSGSLSSRPLSENCRHKTSAGTEAYTRDYSLGKIIYFLITMSR